MRALFDDACRRGVEIEIIIPGNTDVSFLNKINYSYISELVPLGIKFYTGRKMNHAKILIVDDCEAVVGSQNIDMLSFGRNFEVGVFSRQKEIVQDLTEIFDKWKKQATHWQKSKKPLNLLERLMIIILRLFFSII
jgi:cardiolipin synthase